MSCAGQNEVRLCDAARGSQVTVSLGGMIPITETEDISHLDGNKDAFGTTRSDISASLGVSAEE